MHSRINPKYCKKWVFSGERGDTGGHQCGHPSKTELDGFCAIHFPANEKKRREDIEAKWKREREAQKESWDREVEMKRRARAYESLLAVVIEAADHLYTKQDMDRLRSMAVSARAEHELKHIIAT